MKYLYSLLGTFLLFPSLVLAAAATSTPGLIESDVLKVGPNIVISEAMARDVLLLGGDIQINSPVAGDVLAAGGNITINAPVGGDVRVAGGQVTINSRVGGNVTVAGGQVSLTPAAEVAGSLGVWSGQVRLAGTVGGDVYAHVGAGENIQIDSNAIIGGTLTYKAESANAAFVSGTTAQNVIFEQRAIRQSDFRGLGYFFGLMSLFGALVVGLVFVSIAPNLLRRSLKESVANPKQNLWWGLLALLAAPVGIVFLLFTLIGVPLALILTAGYIMVIYLAKVFAGLVVGDYIMRYFKKGSHSVSLLWLMVLGVAGLYIVGRVPFVGWIASALATIWGVGMIVRLKWQVLRQIED